eukprot:1128781-Prymnesium_polylepis.1
MKGKTASHGLRCSSDRRLSSCPGQRAHNALLPALYTVLSGCPASALTLCLGRCAGGQEHTPAQARRRR